MKITHYITASSLFCAIGLSFLLGGCAAETTRAQKTEMPQILYIEDKQKALKDNALLVMSVKDYERIMHHSAPIDKILRDHIDKEQYVALSSRDLIIMDKNKDHAITKADGDAIHKIFLVHVRGETKGAFISTQAKKHHAGTFKLIVLDRSGRNVDLSLAPEKHHTVHFHEGHTNKVKSMDKTEHPHVGL